MKPLNLSTCEITKRVMADNPGNIYQEIAERPCKQGFHKIFLFNDPHPTMGDFHFYKQVKDLVMTAQPGDTAASLAERFTIPIENVISLGKGKVLLRNTGIFSHKLGHATGALIHDSCGKLIRDPRKACRSVGNRTYSLQCGSFCARSGWAKSRKDNQNAQREVMQHVINNSKFY